ncbi:ArsC/Spx/MgsR family protein [Defluviimonas sp. D31]|uniref:arsenate reductase family protein n=1 Tax=Defluviimonas sp. D31 TaxID=3083253 RepID=UPI00296E46BF|nr:ArsC/Spx/MgsR family protein [Defluviimonas sp. D31]MDW4550495.1 ArsC/Spx/MgsR family protein [Defluviimonas sp. D31]
MILYGIASCDSCRKARRALESAGHAVVFHDIRAEPLSPAERERFVAAFGDRLVNRASTTWRALDEATRAAQAAELIAAHPTVMKRPVIDDGATLYLGWDKDAQAALLA